MKNLTASDRSSLIKLASTLPRGDETRKAILAGLSKTSAVQLVDTLVGRWITKNYAQLGRNNQIGKLNVLIIRQRVTAYIGQEMGQPNIGSISAAPTAKGWKVNSSGGIGKASKPILTDAEMTHILDLLLASTK